MTTEAQPEVVPDFIFGTLATDDLRVASMQRERRGLWHLAQLQPLDPMPDEPITITVEVGPDVAVDQVTLYYTSDGSTPAGRRGEALHGQPIQLERRGVEWDTLVWGYRSRFTGSIPPQAEGSQVRYCIEGWQSAGDTTWYVGGDSPQVFGFTVDRDTVPEWLRTGIIYQIFVDRFAPDPGSTWNEPPDVLGGFYGGTLRGVIAQLDELADLGITCLWLTPIFPSPTHHGYDATDYGTIEPRLGTLQDFADLIAGAHARGMRVILDYVANHLSSQHSAFVGAQAKADATTASWFNFTTWPTDYQSFFGVQEMPQINTDDAGAQAYLIDHACDWLTRGADGFRLDYANGPSRAFWSAFRRATRALNAESVMIGEVVETPQLQRTYTGRMDGCLDFLLLQAVRTFFAFRSTLPSQFDRFLDQHFAFFDTDFLLPSFLDNHDMNRFMWVVGGDERRLRITALCQFTLPGPPIIYYGTEVGMNQRRDVRYPDGSGHPEEARFPMVEKGGQNQEVRRFYQQLIALRQAGGAAWQAPHVPLLIDDDRNVYAYRRGNYCVVFNNSPNEQLVSLPYVAPTLVLATDNGVVLSEASIVQLPPFTGACCSITE